MLAMLLLLLGSFFSMYYFYYIPSNKQQLHQYGFRILGRLKTNMLSRNHDLLQLYYNCLTYYNNTDTLLPEGGRMMLLGNDTFVRPVDASDTGRLQLTEIRDGQFIYRISKGSAATGKAALLPVDRFMHPLVFYRHELFDSYFLINHRDSKGAIIYENGEIGVDHSIQVDSLMKLSKGALFSQIIDIEIAGQPYKMFTYPFNMEGHQLMLCGVLKASGYTKRLNSLPATFIYQVVIVLLLLLISLPFIKMYLLGADEQIGFVDLLALTGALFLGITLITAIIIHVLLLEGGYNRAAATLVQLSGQIEQSLDRELGQTTAQLKKLDAALQQPADGKCNSLPLKHWKGKGDSLLRLDYSDPNGYYNFERAVWINDTGQQIFKAQPAAPGSFFIDVRERGYFKYFKELAQQQVPADSAVFVEPINSWATGDFRVNVATRSSVKSMFIVVLVTRMYSLLNTVLPAGYGFCLIDAKGNVSAHSDMNRNLKENFFEEVGTDAARTLREAIIGRQETTLEETVCYGSKHTVHIQPLRRLPFYLVTFYDSNYIVPVNMRILIFALLFSLITGCAVVTVFFLIRMQTLQYSGLQPVAVYFSWMIPRRRLLGFYQYGSIGVAAYLLLFFALAFPLLSDFIILIMALLTPLNMMVILHLYRLRCYNRKAVKPRAYLYLAGIWAGYSLFVYYLLKVRESGDGYQYWLCQLLVLAAGIVLLRKGGRISRPQEEKGEGYIHAYSGFVLVVVLSFCALPVAVFTWFAHNHEIRQAVKKQQLFLANSLTERRDKVAGLLLHHPFECLPKGYYSSLQYGSGLFGIHHDSIMTAIDPAETCDDCNPQQRCQYFSEQYYFHIADRIGNRYYDPFNYPSLYAPARDSAWCWHSGTNTITLQYRFRPDPYLGPVPPNRRGVQLRSTLPQRYYYLNSARNIFFLVLGVLLILVVVLLVIKHMALRVFLQRAVFLFERSNGPEPEPCGSVYEEEQQIIAALGSQRLAFQLQWRLLKEREKLVLLDMALDGWMNYHNLNEISSLLDKRILCIEDGWFRIRQPAFRLYVLQIKGTQEELELRAHHQSQSRWQAMRIPLMVAVLAAALFIFFTQEETFRKVAAAIGAISSILPVVFKLWANGRQAATSLNRD